MTYEKIRKASECCIQGISLADPSCSKCPLKNDPNCTEDVIKYYYDKHEKYRWHDLKKEEPPIAELLLVAYKCIDGITYSTEFWLGDDWNNAIADGYKRIAWKCIEPFEEDEQ